MTELGNDRRSGTPSRNEGARATGSARRAVSARELRGKKAEKTARREVFETKCSYD
jgi:hypothetical protein